MLAHRQRRSAKKIAELTVKPFKIPFNADTTHHVMLILHPTTEALQALGRYKNENSVRDAEGFCWSHDKMHKDGFIAEIHLALDNLTVEIITHEAFHAAYQRNLFIGRVPGSDIEEEGMATDVGTIADNVVAILQQHNLEIKAGA